ncbi:MAG: outer membrane protein assembly factor BamD [Methylococcaceae bacterium]
MRLILLGFKLTCLFVFMFGLSACDEFTKKDDIAAEAAEYADWDVKKFQTEAKDAMESENYAKAIELLEKLEARYPFGPEAAQAQIDVAYAYYKNGDHEASIAATDRFIKIHPRNPSVDYAYYLKGLVNYNRQIGFVERFLPIDSSQRDPAPARDAYRNFEDLLERFPDTKYAKDAKKRMTSLRNNLAMYEIHIARFYMKRDAYIAAANRASKIIKEYQRTPAVPFALQIMQQAYKKLGLPLLASDSAKVYEHNYPDGPPVKEYQKSTVAHRVWDFIGLDK